MALLTLTINNGSPALDKKSKEVQVIQRALNIAEVQIRSARGAATSGNIVDAGVLLGRWTYTPQASS